MEIHTIKFIHASDIIPEDWKSWFWSMLADCNDITFGEVNHSIITAQRFMFEFNGIMECMDEDIPDDVIDLVDKRIQSIIDMKDVYISLE
jgi:hypothetical protein